MAIMDEPNLLLLDEPVSGIDQNGMELFYKTMDYLKTHYDLAIILISHDLDYVAKYADHVVLLDKTVAKQGTVKEVFESKEFERIFYTGEGILGERGGAQMNITSWLQYDFMRNALIAVLIITPLFGIMGTMIVNKKMAYFSDALGHSALTGIAVGVVCGMADTSLAMVIFAIVFALLLNKIGSLNTASTDTIISVFSSCSVAIGLAILSKGGNFSKYSSILVGDVLSITKTEIVYLIVIFVVTIVFWVFCFNKLNAICIHRSVAKSKGIHVRLLDNLFAVLVALIVMLSIKWIGILIINALLILPAASSRNISENMREYHFFSVIFSVFSGIVGLAVSYYTNVATGPMIVIIASVIYFSTFIFGRKIEKNKRQGL